MGRRRPPSFGTQAAWPDGTTIRPDQSGGGGRTFIKDLFPGGMTTVNSAKGVVVASFTF